MIGNVTSVHSASVKLVDKSTTAAMMIIKASLTKSTRLTDRKTQIRSVSLLIRDIKSPVRLPPKNSSESFCKCAYVRVRRSLVIRSLTHDVTYSRVQFNNHARIAAPKSPAKYQ